MDGRNVRPQSLALEAIMIAHDEALRFFNMNEQAAGLRDTFSALTAAHLVFQQSDLLKSISVSDTLEDGSIDVMFNGIRIKFRMLLTVGDDRDLRGRVVCTYFHLTNGAPEYMALGAFSFDGQGDTDLPNDATGVAPSMREDGPGIILKYLSKAIGANSTL
jgi:hypothetical protein